LNQGQLPYLFSLVTILPNQVVTETLADKFDESGGVASPERRRAAIHCLEEDDDLSETEQVAAVRLFSRKTTIADSYLAIKKKSTRTRYIQSELVDFQAL
jgi:hypothetical protein